MSVFQSTLPARGSDLHLRTVSCVLLISIHAPRKGERPFLLLFLHRQLPYFNPRSPQGGATSGRAVVSMAAHYFNPRSPQGGATPPCRQQGGRACHFNPRSPQGGATWARLPEMIHKRYFNPRSPQGGATFIDRSKMPDTGHFNPRSPQGGATLALLIITLCGCISIHAPRKGERLFTVVIDNYH